MTFEEWADEYELDLDTRATCQSAWAEATLAEREAIIARLIELGALDDGTYLEAIRMRSNK